MKLRFEAVEEATPGALWAELFERFWEAYQGWFLSEGPETRVSYLESRHALERSMPEIAPVYHRLCDLAGGGDLAARFLSLYRPPAYVTGCSQAVWVDDDGPVLVRNYDYHPQLLEKICWHSCWTGRRVVAMSDCLWGVLDGMNEQGLAVALAFGGSRSVGAGFGMPVILRYVLECCDDVREACDALARVPTHMAYNVTMTDASGDFRTAQLAPGAAPVFRRFPVATNHQGSVEWMAHAHATQTLERERVLVARYADRKETTARFIETFLRPPVYSFAFAKGYGTLYTAVYRPARRELEFRWPGVRWPQGLDRFEAGELEVSLVQRPPRGRPSEAEAH